MKAPLSKRWNVFFHRKLTHYLKKNTKISLRRLNHIRKGMTMPNLSALEIGSARKMDAAILFFDLANFTSISSQISNESTLFILNTIIPSLTRIVRHWGGTLEKNTGDGIMAIIGTETRDQNVIAQEAIECAMAMRYIMLRDVNPILDDQNLPVLNFRIGVEMEEVLISRIGVKNMNFLTVVGSAANRASKLQELATQNGICLGENLASNLDSRLYKYLTLGEDPSWKWTKNSTGESYNYYHYNFDYSNPMDWMKFDFKNL